jgi:hypothetical protein
MNMALRPRVRQRLRRFAIVSLAVLVPIAAWTIWDYIEARRLARIVDGIRANGEAVAVLPSPRASGGRGNAARYYEAAAALVDMQGIHESTGLLRRLDFPDGRNTSALAADLRAWLERNHDAEQLLLKATELDEYAPLSDFSRNANGMLRVATLADLRAIERLQARDAEGAAEAVIRELEIARLLQSPVNDLTMHLTSSMIGHAISAVPRILEMGAAPETVRSLRTAIEVADRDGLLAELVTAERAFVLSQYWDPDKRWFVSNDAPIVLGRRFSEPLWFAMRPYMTRKVVGQIELMSTLLESARKAWPERLDVNFAEVRKEPARTSSRLYFLTLPYSPWAAVNSHRTRTTTVGSLLAATRSTLTAIAVEEYRRTKAGALPSRLEDLTPAQLRAVPIDPFSGQPLRFKRLPDGYAVYSVGANRVDDDSRGAGTPLRRRWGANQLQDEPLDVGVKVTGLKGMNP